MNAENILEYDKLIEAIATYTRSPGGASLIKQMRPSNDLDIINRRRPLFTDMIHLRETAYDLPGTDALDMTGIFRNAMPEDSILPGEELLSCLSLLETSTALKEFAEEECTDFQEITRLTQQIDPCDAIRNALVRSIDRDGSVLDNASPELKLLRQRIITLEARIQRHLEQMVHSPDWETSLQEHFVTMRNGRYVVPVKKDSRGAMKGIVHDLSNSGQTVFVEPSETLGMGNELSRTRLEERDEVIRILAMLTKQVRSKLDAMKLNLSIISELDAGWAVANWAAQYGCVLPDFGNILKLQNARHPLLLMQFAQANPPKRVIPLNLTLARNIKALAITGSNTGGKTVILKTVGLLCLAAQSGLPVPVSPDSIFPVFDDVLADIGDGQSLQQSLSTFSAHISNICDILKQSKRTKSLVLLDELGSGTDPVEGGALACGILRSLAYGNVLSLVTTHLALVKNFVHSRKDMLNAAVRFNVETLQPEYILEVGRPGASHALLIAKRLGMPENVLKDAQQMMSQDQVKLEDMLTRMEADQRRIAGHASRMATAESDMEAKRDALKAELEELRKKRKQLLLDAHQQADALVENTRREMENLVRQIRENAKRGATVPDVQAEEAARRAIEERKRKLRTGLKMHETRTAVPLNPEDIQKGMRVWVEKLQADGTVDSIFANGSKLSVNVNGLSFTMNIKEVSQAHGSVPAEKQEPVVRIVRPVVTGATPSELNLVGMRVADAIDKLEGYIDRSCMAGLSEVTIVHGFGTGKLRSAIHEYLLTVPAVRDFKLTKDNGGSTDVFFKN